MAEVSFFFQILMFVVWLAFGVEENETKPHRWLFVLHVLATSSAITFVTASTDSYQDQKSPSKYKELH